MMQGVEDDAMLKRKIYLGLLVREWVSRQRRRAFGRQRR
jgi:hypothetical protein